MTWHVDPSSMHAYAADALDPAQAASIESHLVGCAICQRRAAEVVDGVRLATVWTGVVDRVERPRPRAVERVLRWVGVPAHLGRLLAATPALRASWIAAVGVVLGLAVGTAYLSPRNVLLFLVVAPLVALAGVASCYGAVDVTGELGLSLPFPTTRLLLLRALVVFSVCLVLASLAGVFLPGAGWAVAAWVLPAIAVVLVAAALSSIVDPTVAAVSTAAGWIVLVVIVEQLADAPLTAFGPLAQVAAASLAVLAAGVVVLRRGRLEQFGAG